MKKILLLGGAWLLLSFLVKTPCLTQPWGKPNNVEYTRYCYNDAQALYHLRKFDQRLFPYIESRPFEYPPLIGLQTWMTSLVSRTHREFFVANAILNALWAFLALWLLSRMVTDSRRLFVYALGPPIFHSLYLNWDISTVLCVVAAVWAWQTRGSAWAGFFLGLGISGKLFPLFFLPPLSISLLSQRRELFRLGLGVAAGWSLLNVPILIGDLAVNGSIEGWFQTFTFHAKRVPDYGSVWHWFRTSPAVADRWSGALLLLAVAYGAWTQFRKKGNPWAAGAGLICLCLVVSKIHSPQFSLWVLPFFVLFKVPWPLVLGYCVVDILVFVSTFTWMGGGLAAASGWKSTLMAAIMARAVALALIGGWLIHNGRPNYRPRVLK